jgi:hypothetical protein
MINYFNEPNLKKKYFERIKIPFVDLLFCTSASLNIRIHCKVFFVITGCFWIGGIFR